MYSSFCGLFLYLFFIEEGPTKKKSPSKKLTTKFCKLLAEAAEAVKADEPPQFKIPQEKRIVENGKSNLAQLKVSDGTDTVLQNTPEDIRETIGALKVGVEAEGSINSALTPEADTFRMMAATLQNMVISKAEQEKAKKGKEKDKHKTRNGVYENEKYEHSDETASVVSSTSSSSKT